MRFKEFILNEQKVYLSQKVGDILTAAQELKNDAKNMGSRDLSRFSERIVNQIRRVLHSYWSKENQRHLKSLQKVGVALMKSIKEKGDLENIISGVAGELEKVVKDMGVPINKIGSPEDKNAGEDEEVSNVEKPAKDQYKQPESPKTIEKVPDISNPSTNDPELINSPPLGGSSGPLNSM